VASRNPIGTLYGHRDLVSSLAFSPSGDLLLTGSWDNTLILWDVETKEAVGRPLRGHKAAVTCAAFGPDGTTLASGSWDNSVYTWCLSVPWLKLAHHITSATTAEMIQNARRMANRELIPEEVEVYFGDLRRFFRRLPFDCDRVAN